MLKAILVKPRFSVNARELLTVELKMLHSLSCVCEFLLPILGGGGGGGGGGVVKMHFGKIVLPYDFKQKRCEKRYFSIFPEEHRL